MLSSPGVLSPEQGSENLWEEGKLHFFWISDKFSKSCWSGLGHGVLHCLELCLWLHSGEGNKFLPGKKKKKQPWKQLLAAGTKMASSWKPGQSLRKSFDEACFIYCDINSDFFVLFYLFLWWRNHLHAAGHICVLKDAFTYESAAEVANLTCTEQFDAALAIHLYKGGRLLQGNPLSFAIKTPPKNVLQGKRANPACYKCYKCTNPPRISSLCLSTSANVQKC